MVCCPSVKLFIWTFYDMPEQKTTADLQTAFDLISAEGQLTEIVQQCGLSFPSSCELH